jgi:hypothetical protein
MKRLTTPNAIAISLALFGVVAFVFPFLTAIWLDSLKIDVSALLLVVFAGSIRQNHSLRSAVIAQFLSIMYCIGYTATLFNVVFLVNKFTTPGNIPVSPIFGHALQVPVFLLICWSILNAVSLNPFIKNKKIPNKNLNPISGSSPEKG